MEWTTDRVVKESKDWSLEGDCGILEIMEKCEKTIESKVLKTQTNFKDMSATLEEAAISLNNTTNKLGNLQHSLFIENLVKDDVSPTPSTSSCDKNQVNQKDNDSSNPIQILDKILGNNLKMLNNFYEKIDINLNDDSDDDDTPTANVIYRSRNIYHERPLPYIFGSKDWADHWHVGLCDSDDNFSEDEIEEFSDDEDIPPPTPSESEMGSIWNLNQTQPPSSEASSSTKGSLSKIPQEVKRESIPDERFYVHKPKVKANRLFEESDDEDVESVSTHGEKENSSMPKGDLFNEEYNSFMKELEKRVEQRVDSSINTSVVVEKRKISSPKVVKKKEQALREPLPKKVEEAPVITSHQPATKTKLSNLFDDEPPDDDFDHLFGDSNTLKKTKLGTSKVRSVNLFDDDVEEEDPSIFSPNQRSKPISSGFLNDDPPDDLFPNTIEKNIKASDKADIKASDKVSVQDELRKQEKQEKKSQKQAAVQDLKGKDETDLFSKDTAPKKQQKTSLALFDDLPEEDEDSIFNIAPKKKMQVTKKKTLFSDVDMEDDEDDFFSVMKSKESKSKKPKDSMNYTIPSTSLYADEPQDEDDFFVSVVSSEGTKGLDTVNHESDQSKVPQESAHKVLQESSPKVCIEQSESSKATHSSSALFADEPQDDDDFFVSVVSSNNTKAVDIVNNYNDQNKAKQESSSKDDFNEFLEPSEILNTLETPNHEFPEINENMVPEIKSKQNDIEQKVHDEELLSPKIKEKNQRRSSDALFEHEQDAGLLSKASMIGGSKDFEHSSKLLDSFAELESSEDLSKIDRTPENTEEISKKEDWFQPAEDPATTMQPSLFTKTAYFSDEPPEDTTDNMQRSKQLTVPIFNDEPPEDDDFFAAFPVPTKPEPKTMSLFSDEPPEDDNFFGSEEPPVDDVQKTISQKRTSTVFYDDINETKSTISSSNNTVADLIQKVIKPVEPTPRKDPPKVNKLDSSAMKINVSALLPGAKRSKPPAEGTLKTEEDIASLESSKPLEVDAIKTKEQPKINKLNPSNININVSALLPGAKRTKAPVEVTPVTKASEDTTILESLNSSDVDDLKPKEPPKLKKVNINVSALLPGAKKARPPVEEDFNSMSSDASIFSKSSDGLSHITKNRVKGMPKRRPSTRKGRQEMYRKALSSKEDSTPQVIPNTSKPAVTKPVNNASLFSSSDEDLNFKPSALSNHKKKSDSKIDSKSSSNAQKKNVVKPRGLFSSDEEDDELFSEKIMSKSRKKSLPKTSAPKNNLFDDIGNDDDDLFGEQKPKPSNSVKVKEKSTQNKTAKPKQLPKEAPKSDISKNSDNPLADLL